MNRPSGSSRTRTRLNADSKIGVSRFMIGLPGRRVLRIGWLWRILPIRVRTDNCARSARVDRPGRLRPAIWRICLHLVNSSTGLANVSRGGLASVPVEKAVYVGYRSRDASGPGPRLRAQYVQLIARRIRERHAFARIVRHDITAARVRELDPLAVILSGGPASVYERARRLRPGPLRPRRAGPGHLLRDATDL